VSPDSVSTNQLARRAALLIWPAPLWPTNDQIIWDRAHIGKGPDGRDNPAVRWNKRTTRKNEDAYGRYLAWLHREGMLIEVEAVTSRITPERVTRYVATLKTRLSPVSVGMVIAALIAAAKALAPSSDWSWLSRRSARLRFKATPSREKRHAVQHTLDLYRFGKRVMDTADRGKGLTVAPAQRYQSGLMIALLAARPLRIRNFQAITIGQSLRWDGTGYWLTFSPNDTKMHYAIDEPLPGDLIPYLEVFLRTWRPVLLRQANKRPSAPIHRRLWVDRFGRPMSESTLRHLIKRYTQKEFGTAVWPHLFRDCLLTSIAVDQPDLMRIGAAVLGHASSLTGEKHYNQARILEASRRFGTTISSLREAFLATPEGEHDGPDG
jgi:integrase/recombinase XerD